ncbi:hypothetical protein [Thermodesulfovibrio sp. Kuro-1]|uniref:hypothetical protein n=1 Tax=Thermodesulfovibrio sp. Kuro-1 TaxID=2580394 RepID=UPI001142615F|nr:hypothetical protein [Thermodesulfovibrio sp. Kuro-1]
MPFFKLYINYNIFFNVIVGFFYFLGVYWLGYLTNKWIIFRQAYKVWIPYYPVLGTLIVSLLVQLPGFYSVYWFREWITFLFYFLFSLGFFFFVFLIKNLILKNFSQIRLINLDFYFLLLIFVFISSFLISLTPLSKHDELYYHAVLPGRVVLDNGINFYRYPIEAAVLPHMLFHFSIVPLFNVGFPNASNLYAYFFSILLFYLFYEKLKEKTWGKIDKKYIFLLTLLTLIGMHHLVFHTTLGGHAFNEFCMFSLLCMILNREKIGDEKVYYFYIGVLSTGVVGSKISYAPVIIVILIYFTISIIKSGRLSSLVYMYIPFLIFLLPIIVFTYVKSGSPFGPFFIEFFGSKIYTIDEVKNFIFNYSIKLPYLNLEFSYFIKSILFDYSILVVLSLILFLFAGFKMNKIIWLLSILMLIAIYVKLPHDIRFWGGFLYCFVILNINYMTKNLNVLEIFKSKITYKIVKSYILFFLFVIFVYSLNFYNFYFTDDKKKWMFENIGLYEEYLKIDKLVDSDSVILLLGTRGNGAYSPRLIVYDWKDLELHKEKTKYLLYVGNTGELENRFRDYNLIKIYENNSAMITSYRTPFKSKDIGQLTLYRLER